MPRPPANRARTESASPAPASDPAAASPATPPEAGEENHKEAKEVYVTWAGKITSTHKEQLADMLDTAPRQVRMQDLMGYILTEFFSQHKELPEELRQRKSSNRPPRS